MTATREKTAKPLGFEITEPLAMGLWKGKTGLGESADTSLWLRFSVCPSKLSSRQDIYLAPKEEERDDATLIRYDSKKWRRLTPEIKGSLQFNMRSPANQEAGDATKPPIGQLSHSPEYSSSDYGWAESYYIEINLPEN